MFPRAQCPRFVGRLWKHTLAPRLFEGLERIAEKQMILLGTSEANRMRANPPASLRDAEFCVFSQFGEDGIIQFLVHSVDIVSDCFVEIGVQSYKESNTRFLLLKDNWRGLIVDSGTAHLRYARRNLAWRHTLDVVQAFVTTKNINSILLEQGAVGDIGLLSCDIDGNDYWIWQALDVASPRVVVIEFNSTFGSERAVVVPYQAGFSRQISHWSRLYFGASLGALTQLAESQGYSFVGCNSAGNNAFFVRTDVLEPPVRAISVRDGYVPSRFRESRDSQGRPTFIQDHGQRLRLMSDMPLLDVESGELGTVGSLLL